jgi:hypothetical protein
MRRCDMADSSTSRRTLALLEQFSGLTREAGSKGKANSDVATPSDLDSLGLDFSDLTPEPVPPAAKPAASATLSTKPATPSRTVPAKGELAKGAPAKSGPTPGVPAPGSAAPTGPAPVVAAWAIDAPPPEGQYLDQLFDRVNTLLNSAPEHHPDGFVPREPTSIEATGLTLEEIEKLALKFLLARGSASGRKCALQACLPFNLVEPLLKSLKSEQLVAYRGTATMGDYEYNLTDLGRERARRYSEESTYFGACPVALRDYLTAMAAQSIAKQHCTQDDLEEAFSDLIINTRMLDKLGPAINSGRGMFLFGEPGNGKTSIAERVTSCFGSSIWIPRAISIDGEVMRLFDPAVHLVVEEANEEGLFNLTGIDARWVQIRRPTVVVGGELTMAELEVRQNSQTGICESPVQLKSNCGTLVIDDFGRQRMPVTELLNRWIVPLEKRYDYLNMPSGKKIQVPFDQIIIFSTNLEPKDLVDGAFLRRIPYKIKVEDPTRDEFQSLFERLSPSLGFRYDRAAVDDLIDRHYVPVNRPFRSCQPRDLLLQVRNYCNYHELPKVMSPQAFDFAVENYFSIM